MVDLSVTKLHESAIVDFYSSSKHVAWASKSRKNSIVYENDYFPRTRKNLNEKSMKNLSLARLCRDIMMDDGKAGRMREKFMRLDGKHMNTTDGFHINWASSDDNHKAFACFLFNGALNSLFSVKCDDKRHKNAVIYHRIESEKGKYFFSWGVPE